MQRLNIPLKTGASATRLSHRRVVWQFASVLVIAFAFFVLVSMAIGRTTLLATAPIGDVVDLVGRNTISQMAAHMGNVPLLPGTPLTLNQLLPHIRREVAYAILPDGEHLVAFQGTLSDDDVAKFQANGIFVLQKTGLVILGGSEIGAGGSEWKIRLRFPFAAWLPGYAGRAKIAEQRKTVFLGPNGFGLRSLFRPLGKTDTSTLPSSTLAFLSFPADASPIPAYLPSLFGLGLDGKMQELLANHSGKALILSDNAGLGYLLELDAGIDSQTLTKLLQASVSLAHPVTQTATLADGTLVEELSIDPSAVKMSVQEGQNGGVLITAEEGETKVIARRKDDLTRITNRPELMETTLPNKGSSVVYPSLIAESLSVDSTHTDVWLSILSLFKKVEIFRGNIDVSW